MPMSIGPAEIVALLKRRAGSAESVSAMPVTASALQERLRAAPVPPRDLPQAAPRDVVLAANGRLIAVLMALLVVGAAIGTTFISREIARQTAVRQELAATGVDTTGAVTRLWRDGGKSKQPWVAYRFEAGGSVYERSTKMDLSRWRTLEPGAAIVVRYVPADPRESVIVGSEPDDIPGVLLLPIAAILAAFIVGFAASIRSQRRLLADGRATPALVTGVNVRQGQNGRQTRIEYAFPLPSGAVATGKAEVGSRPVAADSVIWVVYDPDRPARSRPYPFPLVRPARFN